MRIAFVFSGQGAQFPGMFQDLYSSNAEVKRVFDLADESLKRSISDICFNGTQEDLNLTHNTQPCVLAADLAAARALIGAGIKPDAVAGFSLGEYAAMTIAGVMDEKDVFPVIQVRADAMQEAVPVGQGGMAAIVGKSSEEVEALCTQVEGDYVIPANYNSPVQTVVSGSAAGVDKLVAIAEEQGIRAVKLQVSAPFHCELMHPAADKLKVELDKCALCEPEVPVYLNYTAKPLAGAAEASEMLFMQAFNPVRWAQTVQNMVADGVDTFIECGPGKTLSGLIKKTVKGVDIYRVESADTLEKTLAALQKAE